MAEPADVQGSAGLRFHPFEAGDELAVSRAGVPREAVRQCSDRLEDQFFLFVPDSCEVRDLGRREVFDADVDMLARAGRCSCSGSTQGAHHLLQGVEVVPVEDRGDHLCRGRAAAEAAVADCLPFFSVVGVDRPFVVAAARVGDAAADHALDCSCGSFAAEVSVFESIPKPRGFAVSRMLFSLMCCLRHLILFFVHYEIE